MSQCWYYRDYWILKNELSGGLVAHSITTRTWASVYHYSVAGQQDHLKQIWRLETWFFFSISSSYFFIYGCLIISPSHHNLCMCPISWFYLHQLPAQMGSLLGSSLALQYLDCVQDESALLRLNFWLGHALHEGKGCARGGGGGGGGALSNCCDIFYQEESAKVKALSWTQIHSLVGRSKGFFRRKV